MDAVALAREAQLSRLKKLAPPPVIGALEPEPEPEPEPMQEDDDVPVPPPVRGVIEFEESSEFEPAPQLASPALESVVSAANRLVTDLVEEAARRAESAGRTRREGGDWWPQIDSFWVTGSAPPGAAAAGAFAGRGDDLVRDEDFDFFASVADDQLERSRAWRRGVA
jgi:hypothetical protein